MAADDGLGFEIGARNVFLQGMQWWQLFGWVWLVLGSSTFELQMMAGTATAPENSLLVYFGTYTGPGSQGIYAARFDPVTGELGPPKLAAEAKNPTFLALDPTGRRLYAASEVDHFEGKPQGGVLAYGIEKSGELRPLNQEGSGGAGPCHLAVDRTGACVLVANYGSGSVAALPLRPDGGFGGPASAVQHQGSSVNPQRQAGPHAHFITTAPKNRFALACDLGLDKVLVYRLESAKALLSPAEPPAIKVQAGSGPRHLAFHPNGRFVYLLNELASRLDVFGYDERTAKLNELQSLSTLPPDFTGENLGAEVLVHPSGNFVFASNRGHNSIAVFRVLAGGKLELVQREPCQGRTPRHFVLAPGGKWMLVENQDSNNVAVFKVDPESGRLASTGNKFELSAPVCAVFVSLK